MQICLEPPEASAEGSTKVPPRFHQGSSKGAPGFHQSSSSFVVCQVLWARSVLGCHPPRFQEGCASFVISVIFWARSLSERFCKGSPHHFFTFVPQFLQLFFASFWTELALGLGAFSHSKGLGAKWHVCLLGFFAANGFASQKVLWSVPKTVLYIGLTVSCGVLGKWLGKFRKGSVEGSANYSLHLSPTWVLPVLLHKSSLEGSANCSLHLSPSLLLGVKIAWIVDVSHPFKSSPQKTTHHVVAVAVSHSKGFGAEQLSDSLWFSGADPSWAAKKFRGRHQGFTVVPPRFHEGCASFVTSVIFWARSLSFPKGSAKGPPHHFFTFVPQFLQLFFASFWTSFGPWGLQP